MPNVARRPQWLNEKSDFTFGYDFHYYTTAHDFTDLAADVGVTAPNVGDAVNGRLSMSTGATDNNEVGFRTTAELFLMDDGRPCWCAGRIQFTEANTDDANVAFGFTNAFGANLLVDNGAGPKTTGNFALIYKIDGGTVWRAASRNSTQTTDSISTVTAGGASFQELEIEIVEYSTTQCEIIYKVDTIPLRDSATGLVISHRLDYASATEMHFGGYLKAGSANSETLLTDWVAFGQVR